MSRYLARHRTDLMIIGLFGLVFALSFIFGWQAGEDAAASFRGFALEMIVVLPVIFLLIGLVDAWVPNEVVARHTGDGSGWKSSLWMILFAMLQVGPLYGAFPVAGLMWRKGTSPRNIFIYLGAFSTLKLPMIGFEVGFLGLKFTLLRTALAVPVFLVMAIVMDKAFGKAFVVNGMATSLPPAPCSGDTSARHPQPPDEHGGSSFGVGLS